MNACRISASWVLRIDGSPLRDAAVLVDHDGRVVLVGPDDSVPTPPGVATAHFDDAVVMPGLVNAHTHLELTGFAGKVEDDDFPSWIRHLRQLKAERTHQEIRAAAQQGIRDCFAAGITTVADTGDSGTVMEALAIEGGSGVCYQEVFGPDPSQCDESIRTLSAQLDDLEQFRSVRRRLGISPHAPYSVSGALYSASMGLAAERRLPVATHIAESAAESQLLESGTGPFAEMWTSRGIPLLSLPGRSPVTWIDRHGVLTPRTLCIHAVRVNVEDIARLALSGAAVAHCPRSNRRHGHGDAPLAALFAAGVRVGIGTDSVASVGDLDLFAEARLARDLGGVSAERALGMITLDAARAIGLADEVGHLGRGCWGDMTVVRVGATESPVETVLAGGPDSVWATYVAGKQVHRAP